MKQPPEATVLKLTVGERIALTVAPFEMLSEAFFAEIETRLRTQASS